MQKSNVGNFFGTKLRIRKKRNKQTELIIYTYSCTFLIIVDALIAFFPIFPTCAFQRSQLLATIEALIQSKLHFFFTASQSTFVSPPPQSAIYTIPFRVAILSDLIQDTHYVIRISDQEQHKIATNLKSFRME